MTLTAHHVVGVEGIIAIEVRGRVVIAAGTARGWRRHHHRVGSVSDAKTRVGVIRAVVH